MDDGYQSRTTMQYLAAEIEGGWNAAHEREHTDPHRQPARPAGGAVVAVLVSPSDAPKFRQPTDAVGDWRVVREARFEHQAGPWR